ncbi:hypothetical protein ACFDTO_29555 [Microbacteriaceae bacterium 4G12]
MAPFIRKAQIINNIGVVRVGSHHNLSPFAVAKAYNGSGSNSAILIKRCMEEVQSAMANSGQGTTTSNNSL